MVFHLGLPKTATTTLQNSTFPDHPSLFYLGKHHPKYTPNASRLDKWLKELKSELVQKDRPFFKRDYPQFRKKLEERFGKELEEHKNWLISEEGILARCLRAAKYGRFTQFGSAYDIFDKLALLFQGQDEIENVKMILVIRRQDELLHSFFAQDYINFKAVMGFKRMSQYVDHLYGKGDGDPSDSLLDYGELVTYMRERFGKDQVLVLPYEMFVEHPKEFLDQMADFIGVEPWTNIESKAGANYNKRRLNKATKKAKGITMMQAMNRVKRKLIGDKDLGWGEHLSSLRHIELFQSKVSISEEEKARIMERYAESNRRLEDIVPMLGHYNYY